MPRSRLETLVEPSLGHHDLRHYETQRLRSMEHYGQFILMIARYVTSWILVSINYTKKIIPVTKTHDRSVFLNCFTIVHLHHFDLCLNQNQTDHKRED